MTTPAMQEAIEHYGIKGMKWGVRRSPDQLARARGERKEKKKKTPPPTSEDAKKARAANAKIKEQGMQSISNAELKELNKRLNMEQQYRNMTKEQKRKLTDADKQMIGTVISGVANIALMVTRMHPATAAVGTALTVVGMGAAAAGSAASRRPAIGNTGVEVLEVRRN